MSTSPSVVVVGSVNRDYVCRVATIPLAGQTLLGGRLTVGSGGKGGNQAVASALLGAPTAMVACIGNDPDGEALVTDLLAAGVDVSGVLTVEGVRSGTAFVMVAGDGENSIVVAPGANDSLDGETVRESLSSRLRQGDLLVLQAETPESGVRQAVDDARRVGARVVLNLAPYRDVSADLLTSCDPVVVNEGEARALLSHLTTSETAVVGLDASELAAELGRRARSAVVTLGAAGAVLAEGETVQHLPAESVRVLDTTGAGDAFIGAVAAALTSGADLLTATRLGVAVGSYAVTGAGAQASYPHADQLPASLRANLSFTASS